MFDRAIAIWKSLKVAGCYLLAMHPSYQEAVEQYPDKISARTTDNISVKTKSILKNDLDKCTACGDCILICPTVALKMEKNDNKKTQEARKFVIDMGRCVLCSLCIEICPAASLSYKQTFEVAAGAPAELLQIFDKTKESYGKEPISVHEKIQKIRSYEIRR